MSEVVEYVAIHFLMFGIGWCILEKNWTVSVFKEGVEFEVRIILIDCVLKLPIYLLSRKYPKIKKNMDKIYLGTIGVLVLLCVVILLCLS